MKTLSTAVKEEKSVMDTYPDKTIMTSLGKLKVMRVLHATMAALGQAHNSNSVSQSRQRAANKRCPVFTSAVFLTSSFLWPLSQGPSSADIINTSEG